MTSTVTTDPLGTILSIWAHPDDETYLAGALMAAARDRGQRVVCVAATAGEIGTPDPGTWPPERLAPVRRWEAAAAMAVLGVTEHHILGLPDSQLDRYDEQGVDLVGRLIDDVRPDTLVTFGPDGMTFHPDHIAVHRWVTTAWDQRGRAARLLYAATTVEHIARYRDMFDDWGMYMSDKRPTGVPAAQLALHLEPDGPALDRKVTALRAMATQTSGLLQVVDLGDYAGMVGAEAFVDAHRG